LGDRRKKQKKERGIGANKKKNVDPQRAACSGEERGKGASIEGSWRSGLTYITVPFQRRKRSLAAPFKEGKRSRSKAQGKCTDERV